MERKCIICGNDNPRPRSKFCSEQCLQKYCYERKKEELKEYKKKHYQEHKDEYIERAKKYQKKHKDEWNTYQSEYQKNRRKELKDGGNENEKM